VPPIRPLRLAVVVTGTAQQAAWAARVPPPVEQARPGPWSVPTPIPDNPLHYVLSYWFQHAHGVVVVDPGGPTRASASILVG